MFACKTNQNRRLYRYPTQPDPQSLLNATNILKEVTNSYENTIQNQDKQQSAVLKNSEDIQKSDQKENVPQHMAHPSVVIKNTTQNYKSMIENVPNFTASNCSTLHSHSNSNGSTVSHVRSASDADSVVFLGPEDSSSNGGEVQVKSPELSQFLQMKQLQQLQFQQQMQNSQKSFLNSSIKSQKNSNDSKGDDTFNLSISNEIITIPTVFSESQNASIESIKQNKNQQVTTAPTGNTNENQNSNVTTNQNTPRNDLYIYCTFCKNLTQAEIYSVLKDQRFKSGMMTFIVEFVCCMNNKNSLKQKKQIGFRCQQCKQVIAKVGQVAEVINY